MDKYISFINDPILQTVLAFIGVFATIFLAFRKAIKPSYSFHKERYNLIKDFLTEFEQLPQRKLAIEELFSSLWNTKKITFPEIFF